MILAADVGGTKTNIAYFAVKGRQFIPFEIRSYSSKDFKSLEDIVQAYRTENAKPVEAVCFGIAATILEGRAETLNIPWKVEAGNMEDLLKIKPVHFINDLEATAYGIPLLANNEFYVLNQGRSNPAGNAALIAAGTGLGEANIFWDGKTHRPSATEGGHSDFAPRNDTEIALLQYLTKKYSRVSYERIVSGPGLVSIYQFIRDTGLEKEPESLIEVMKSEDPAPIIARLGMGKKNKITTLALDLFVSIYGAETGNMALRTLATHGIFIGGGIAPKILHKLKDGTFMKSFIQKGRLEYLLKDIPVKVILNDKTALFGAARYATL